MHDIQTKDFEKYRYFIIYNLWGMAIHKFCKTKKELNEYIEWIKQSQTEKNGDQYSILQLGELTNWQYSILQLGELTNWLLGV